MDVHTQQQQIEGYCRTLALSIYYMEYFKCT